MKQSGSFSPYLSVAKQVAAGTFTAFLLLWLPAAVAQTPKPLVSFQNEVAPLLAGKCISCHGEGQQMAALNLSSPQALQKGGQSGPAILAGQAEKSRLYRRVAGLEQPAMPLGPKLTDAEIGIVKSWIDSGARWEGPALVTQAKPREKEDPRSWWAFQRPLRAPLPVHQESRWNSNPVDAFVKANLNAHRLVPAPAANKRILIRRAYLDLTGLLPDPAEVDAFLGDSSPQAFEKVVDRLLASPRYGERWGRHWLDLVRYADSWGHIHDDDNPNAWRYRDYVIQAFNEDKPYNQFIVEQLAGDEIDDVTNESLIATGFGRVGPRVRFREKQNPQYRYDYLDDLIGTTSRGFLGLTVNCARCHDHKFDPIPQSDYYRMMSSFFGFVDYDHPLVPAREYAEYQARKTAVENLVKPLKAAVREIEEPYRRAIFEKKLKTFPADIQASLKTPEAQRTAGQKLLATQVLSITSAGRRELALSSPDREQIGKLEAQIWELERQLPPPPPMASGIRDGDYRFTPDGNGDEPVPGTTANRISADFPGSYVPKPGAKYVPPPLVFPVGDPGGKEVQPGFLTVIDQGRKPTEHRPSNNLSTSGRRRALAEWIASEDNPLTARVMVNRLWQHHFGRGIVSTPSNFGKMGSRPANPELLDWLATEFINGGWSTKKIQRIIMTSQTYQMASDYGDTDNLARDADNTCLWRFPLQRVEAEAVRDVILNASGNLNLKAGGPPFFPAVPPAVREDVKKIGRWELTKEDPTTWRRGVYSYYKRAMKYPMFEVLDVPDSNITCERRSTTTVPTQALTLMNNEFVLMQTRFFAKRVLESAGDNTAKQISTAYQIALSREPTTVELRGNQEFLSKQKVWHEHGHSTTDRPAEDALTDLCAVILNLNEFVFIN